jgi:hypothetical protein
MSHFEAASMALKVSYIFDQGQKSLECRNSKFLYLRRENSPQTILSHALLSIDDATHHKARHTVEYPILDHT